MVTSRRVVLALFLLLFSTAASATNRGWVGASSGVWSDPDNWSPASAPVSGDTLIFPNAVLALTNDIDGLSLAGLGGGAAGSTLDGNSLTVTQYASLGVWVVNVDLTLDGDFVTVDGDFRGAFDVSGGTVSFPSFYPSAVIRGPLTGSGTLRNSVQITHDGTFSGTAENGFLAIDGASLPNLDVNSSILLGNGSVGAVAVATVSPSTTLSSPAFQDGTAATLSMASLSLSGRYYVDIDSGAAASDRLIVAGDVTLSEPLSLSVAGPAPAVGQSFVIIDHAGAAPVNGHFAWLNNNTALSLTEGTVFNLSGTYYRITYQGGDGNDVVLVVVAPPAGTSTVVSVSPASVLSGQQVTFTANVSYLDGGPVPSGGTVTFFLAGSPVTNAPVVNGVATATSAVNGSTTFSVTAKYSGSSNALASESGPVPLTVHTVPVTMEAHTSPNPSAAGDPVRLFVTLTDEDDPSAPVSGTITVLSGTAPEGFRPIIGGRVGPFSGTVEIDLTGLSAGNYVFTVEYDPYAPFDRVASQTVQHTINAPVMAPTTAALTLSSTSISYGAPIHLSAAVTRVSPGTPAPTGAVTFLVDGHSIGTIALTNGIASMDTDVLDAGSHSFTASYGGDSSNAVSTSAPVIAIVARAATSVGYSAAPHVNTGEPFTIHAEVLPSGVTQQTATGTISVSDGGTVVASESVSHGVATLIIVGLAPGNHQLLVSYSGDGNLLPSSVIVPIAVGLPVISIFDAAVAEGNAGGSTRVMVAMTLSAPSTDFVRVAFATIDGTARAGEDYEAARGVVEFAPGETVKQIEIAIVGDSIPEPVETFSVILSDPLNATIGIPSAAVSITNDDQVLPRHRAVRP